MSIDADNEKIAIVRKACDESAAPSTLIEVWDIKNSPCVEQKIHECDSEPALVEAICWGKNGRLFSCGCDGYINEYDLAKNCIKHKYEISNGPLWCLAINPSGTKLVFGSEDGCISLVDLMEDGFGEVQRLSKMSSRVLSLAWMKNQDKVIAGSQGIISIHDHESKRLLEKIELGDNCLVWSLATFNDLIISGDSKGYTSFWDSVKATLVNRYHSHRSDVLTVFASKKGLVYSSGIDPVIAQFDVHATRPLIPINAHTHDVRAIVIGNNDHIYSGGQDINLVRTITHPKSVTKFYCDFSECINFCGDILSVQYLRAIELFNLDMKNIDSSPKEAPIKLATIRSKHNIIASAVNSNWVVYGTYKDVVFVNSVNELVKVRHSISLTEVVSKMSFLDTDTLAIATATRVHVVSLANCKVTEIAVQEFDHRIVSLSTCPESIAVALSNCELIYMPAEHWTPISVSKLSSITTAMSFNPFESNKLYICTSNKTLWKFNLERTNLKMDVFQDLTKLEADNYFRGLAYTKKSVLIYTNSGLNSFDSTSFSFKTRSSNYKSIISVNSVICKQPIQIVLVEFPEEQFIKLLPPAFMKKVFGAE